MALEANIYYTSSRDLELNTLLHLVNNNKESLFSKLRMQFQWIDLDVSIERRIQLAYSLNFYRLIDSKKNRERSFLNIGKNKE
jgi:hypothetical protein